MMDTEVTVFCPRCGAPVPVPVLTEQIKRGHHPMSGGRVLKVTFSQMNVPHVCKEG